MVIFRTSKSFKTFTVLSKVLFLLEHIYIQISVKFSVESEINQIKNQVSKYVNMLSLLSSRKCEKWFIFIITLEMQGRERWLSCFIVKWRRLSLYPIKVVIA